MSFKIISEFRPTGDQPEAIRQLVEGLRRGDHAQTLLGVTGSGKTFTVANVIEQVQRPTIILSHNKTLAAQLYGEFKQFFPENAVEYFVSYYDYYQPEAFIPSTNTYIEKDLAINDEIEKLRLSTTTSLLSGRQDVLVVSSVSCIYGIGNPGDFKANTIRVREGEKISRNAFLHKLVTSLYSRTDTDFDRGKFRVRGDTVDVFIAYGDIAYRFYFFGDEIEEIASIDPINGKTLEKHNAVAIYPANIFVTNPERQLQAIWQIQEDMMKQVEYMKSLGQHLEAKRLEDRVTYDLEMIRELGYCSGIENYSRYFDGRDPGQRPFCLLDYFPEDYLLVIDESHVTVPQIRAMYGGDRSRKQNLVEYGFRLRSRPQFAEAFLGAPAANVLRVAHHDLVLLARDAAYENPAALGDNDADLSHGNFLSVHRRPEATCASRCTPKQDALRESLRCHLAIALVDLDTDGAPSCVLRGSERGA